MTEECAKNIGSHRRLKYATSVASIYEIKIISILANYFI